jgi:uncharacterized protein with GYD domain
MATYMYQGAYTAEAWASMAKNPQDRIAAVTPVIESLGGKVLGGWFSFGEYDVVAIFECPDDISSAAFAVAVAAGGAISSGKTTPLLTPAEAMQVMTKAGEIRYAPPSA